ncbi:class A beta-lactamase [Streptomyces sp. NPDC004690]
MTDENHSADRDPVTASPVSGAPTGEVSAGRPPTRGARTRRTVLAGGLAGAAAALTGCGGTDRASAPAAASPRTAPSTTPSASSAPSTPPPTARAEAQLAALERRFGGRIGVYAVDTGTGAEVRHRAGERFLMCSTHKLLTVAAVLRARRDRPDLLDQVVPYRSSDVIAHSPATAPHVADGMTVAALCRAALTLSDNTAANLLLRTVGGPAAVTRLVRALGDPATRLDRTEPHVNDADGVLDTTTPAHLAADLRALTLGHALEARDRDRLLAWLDANTTGDRAVRAGCPRGWRIGDKTGSGSHGESNDVAVIRPPHRAPLVLTVFTAPADPRSTAGQPTIAEAARIVAAVLGPLVWVRPGSRGLAPHLAALSSVAMAPP